VTEARAERRTMRQNIRELPPAAWFLTIGAFINRFASFASVFLVLYLTQDLGFSVARAGVAVAAFGVGEVSASIAGGHLADRIGRRGTIALSMFCSAAAMLVLSQLHAYWALVGVAFAAGLSGELYRPAGGALIADVVPEGQRVTAFALLRFAVNLGFAGGVAVAGFLATHSFFRVFVTDAATSVAFGIIALTALPEGRRTSRSEDVVAGAGYRSILSDRAFVLFLGASALIAFVYFQQQVALPLHVKDTGLSFTDLGILLSINGTLVVLLELPISSLTMRRPAPEMLALGMALVGVGFGLTAVSHSMLTLAGTVTVWTFGEMIASPVGYAYVADIAPEHMRGRYQGIYGLFWASGTVTGPLIGAVVFARTPGGFWAVCAVLGVVAAAMVLAGRHGGRLRKDSPSGPDPELITVPEVVRHA
jgi:MFS family permease